jgi:hypothetical protein
MNVELTPEQRQAEKALEKALNAMWDACFGADGIRHVLEGTFSGVCNEMAGGVSDRTWRRDADPYFQASPGGRIRAAESAIVPGNDPK